MLKFKVLFIVKKTNIFVAFSLSTLTVINQFSNNIEPDFFLFKPEKMLELLLFEKTNELKSYKQ